MKNFLNLTKDFAIEIPIIQRDYVQGRDDEDAEEVRKSFLDDIFDALENKQIFPLDFIYGSIEGKKFIPIDGQQRLTTLLLLYWYFSKKEDMNFEVSFSYETRVSSRRFCERLFEFEINFNLNGKDAIKNQIIENRNFIPFWGNDPTIKSMLVMMDEIHNRGYNKSFFNELNNITFELFELKDFGTEQSEELYRKMNSRGKSLTKFENFKAIIEQILYKKNDKTRYKEVAHKFEIDWVDIFWDNYKDSDSLIDDSFMNYIYLITEMLAYEQGKNSKIDIKKFSFLKEFYKDENNLNFLIDALDAFKDVEKDSKILFKEMIFFEKSQKINLLADIVESYSNSTITTKILLFFIIKSAIGKKKNIKLFIRMARNILYRYRALRRAGYIEYTITLDYNDIENLLNNLNKLLDNPYNDILNIEYKDMNFSHEKAKAELLNEYPNLEDILFKLEDFKYLKGDIRLFLDARFSFLSLEKRVEFLGSHLEKIFKEEDNLIIRAMLSINDYTLWVGSVNDGYKHFFGQIDRWEILLTYNPKSNNNIETYSDFFERYAIDTDLAQMIEDKLIWYKKEEKDWKYYFLKYPIITQTTQKLSNTIGWYGGAIEKLQNEKRLTDWHINIYLYALLNEIQKELTSKNLQISDVKKLSSLKIDKFKISVKEDCIIYRKNKYPLHNNDDAIEIVKKLISPIT